MRDTVLHPYFGSLDLSQAVLWRGNIDCNGRLVPIEMTSTAGPSAAQLDAMVSFVRDIGRFDAIARQQLQPTNDAVALYVEHHLAELSNDDLSVAFGTSNKSQLTTVEFIHHLVLRRVGLYPNSSTAILDYGLDGDVTQYVLAVTLGQDGSTRDVSMES